MIDAILHPLLADAVGQIIIAVIVGFIFLAKWVFSQIQDTKKQVARQRAQQQPAQRVQQPRPQRPQAAAPFAGQPAGQAGPVGQQADPLRDQVEAFLRRAAKQQQQQPRQPPPQQAVRRPPQPRVADKIEILIDDEPAAERRTLSKPFQPMRQPELIPLEPVPARGADIHDPRRDSVAQHVAQHVSASARSIGQQTSQLGQRIITEDEQFDVQLKAKFDHAVGTLAASGASLPSRPAESPQSASVAGQIAAMLSNPEGVRQAVVLNEILRRPADRR
jgi:hypothetical protein